MKPELRTCTPKALPRSKWIKAAERARQINPVNHPPLERLMSVMRGFALDPMRIAVVTTKYWGPAGVKLTVGFLDSPPTDLRKRILLHMNAWAKTANISFVETRKNAQVRIARQGGADGGYWSYLGTEILEIDDDEATMNLEGFTMQMPESEFVRVVRHETGHTLGFPHEHMRRQLVKKIDRQKAIDFFRRTQGWSKQEVIQQVLTPLEESTLRATAKADPNSIMCYQIPGFLTKDGKPILGGKDIDAQDAAFAAAIYAKPGKPKAVPKKAGKRSRKRKAAR
jgi:hypothetical protein